MAMINDDRGTDAFGRKMTYLRLSLTSRCQLKCTYCQPKKQYTCCGDQSLTLEEMVQLVKSFVHLGVTKVRLTGGEPLLYPEIISLIRQIRGIKGLKEITLTTNGLLLQRQAKALKEAGLHRVNISLDTLKPAVYQELTGVDGLEQVLEGIQTAIEVGLTPVRLNVVLLKGVNDGELSEFIQWTKRVPVDIRFIELMPIGEGINLQQHYMSTEEALEPYPMLEPIPTDGNSVARYYKIAGAMGRIGTIPAVSEHFCHQCNRIRINAMGELKYCLLRNERADLKTLIRSIHDEQQLEAAIANLLKQKPVGYESGVYTSGQMYQIGG